MMFVMYITNNVVKSFKYDKWNIVLILKSLILLQLLEIR